MKVFSVAVFSLFILNGLLLGQGVTRDEKFRQIKELNALIEKKVQDLLLPEPSEIKTAENEGLKVFRLMPREVYGHQIAQPGGGGSYYSFTTGSNNYGKISQIGLEQNSLKTGFAGADYGLMADLGEIPLSDVTPSIPAVNFLLEYRAPTNILEARAEQRKRGDYKVGDLTFSARQRAIVGHSYVLRALVFGNADILVALRLVRKDTDGSLIIFWKQLAEFEKPQLDPNVREN